MHFWTNKHCHSVCSWGLCSVLFESLGPVCSPCSCSSLYPVGERKGLFFYFCNSSRAYSNERHLEPPSAFHFHSEAYFTHPKHSSISHLSHHFSECKSRHKAGLLLKDSVLQCLFMLTSALIFKCLPSEVLYNSKVRVNCFVLGNLLYPH